MTILLVTGSRALADTPRAEQWARERLEQSIQSAAVIVCGDARGVDQLAFSIARAVRLETHLYCLDGLVRVIDSVGAHTWQWHLDPDRGRQWHGPTRWPLERNRAMVESVVKRESGEKRCLALIAPWSRTHGTGHTARLAERAGIAVERVVCPVEYGPLR